MLTDLLIVVAATVFVVIVLFAVLTIYEARKDERARHDERAVRCDRCDQPATVHLVATFEDATEGEMVGGGSAMRADYCAEHAPDA